MQLATGTANSSPSRSPTPNSAPTLAPMGKAISNQAGCKPTMLPISRGWIT